jgi:hypothetical protein
MSTAMLDHIIDANKIDAFSSQDIKRVQASHTEGTNKMPVM